MKRRAFVLAVAFIGLLTWVAISNGEVFSDKIAAVVNGDVILDSDIKRHKQPLIRNLTSLPLGIIPPGKWPTEREILDELIVLHLLDQEAAKKGIKIDDRALDASLESIRKRNKLDQDQFAIFLMANGLTVPEYRKIMKRQFTLTKLITTEVMQKIPLNEDDVIRYFKQNKNKIDEQYKRFQESMNPSVQPPQQENKTPEVPTHEEIFTGGKLRLHQITLKVPSDAKPKDIEKITAKARQIFQEAVNGEDFIKLAKKYSEDPNAANGGDLGMMNYKDMVPAFQKLVQRMKVGDITPPIKTPNAILMFYLAEAKDRTSRKVPIPEKVRKELEKKMKQAQVKNNREAKSKPKNPASVGVEGDEEEFGEKPKIPPGLLTAEEEKEYIKVRKKIIEILKYDKIQARMKEWIDELKKNSIIEVKL